MSTFLNPSAPSDYNLLQYEGATLAPNWAPWHGIVEEREKSIFAIRDKANQIESQQMTTFTKAAQVFAVQAVIHFTNSFQAHLKSQGDELTEKNPLKIFYTFRHDLQNAGAEYINIQDGVQLTTNQDFADYALKAHEFAVDLMKQFRTNVMKGHFEYRTNRIESKKDQTAAGISLTGWEHWTQPQEATKNTSNRCCTIL